MSQLFASLLGIIAQVESFGMYLPAVQCGGELVSIGYSNLVRQGLCVHGYQFIAGCDDHYFGLAQYLDQAFADGGSHSDFCRGKHSGVRDDQVSCFAIMSLSVHILSGLNLFDLELGDSVLDIQVFIADDRICILG